MLIGYQTVLANFALCAMSAIYYLTSNICSGNHCLSSGFDHYSVDGNGFTACKDLKRKSKCPCLCQGVYCSKYCKCFNCGNRHENQKLSDSSTAVGCRSESRKRPIQTPTNAQKVQNFWLKEDLT